MGEEIQHVRIPRTSGRRGEDCWARLLSKVDRQTSTVFGFHGTLFRCGEYVPEPALWPSPDYPPVPILLEHAGIATPGWGHDRSEHLYILWRYETKRHDWSEIARAVSKDGDWTWQLQPIARKAIEEQAAPRKVAVIAEVRKHVLAALDQALEPLSAEERKALLAGVYDGLASRMVELQDWKERAAS